MDAFDPTGTSTFVNGEYVDGADAKVSVFDRGLTYGDGVFDSMPVVSRALFRPMEHLARLNRSAKALRLRMPYSEAELLEISLELVRRSTAADANLRIVLTRGDGRGFRPGDVMESDHPNVHAIVHPTPPLMGRRPGPPQAISLLTSLIVRKAPGSIGSHVKSLNYIESILAVQQAASAGMDDGIIIDFQGAVAECSASNLFAILGERLVTPTTRAALPGITRQTVLEIAAELDIEALERDIWPQELYLADAIFQTGSGAGIVPVGSIDGHTIESTDNALFKTVSDAYTAMTRDPRYVVAADARVPA